jgi:hypothetical protein
LRKRSAPSGRKILGGGALASREPLAVADARHRRSGS